MKNPEVSQFSKEHSQEQRDQAAREIREKRAGYFERKKTHDKEINILETETTEKEQEVTRITQEIQELDNYLDNLNENILSRISHFLEIKKAREAIWPKKSLYRVGSQELAQLSNLLTKYQEQQLDRRELAEAKEILGEFWQGQSEAWQEYQEEEKARDVKNVCLDNNCAVVHCLHPGFTPKHNSILNQGATWQDKLKILLALEPVISTSTVRQGDDGNINLWSKMGVILSGGKTKAAFAGDAGTFVTKEMSRERGSGYSDKKIQDQIRGAITGRTGYNELVVQNPEFAGFFVCLDPSDNPYDNPSDNPAYRLAYSDEVEKTVQEYQMPFYILKGGQFYRAEVNQETGALSQGEEVRVQALVNQRYDIDGRRDDLIENILDGAPFKKEVVAENEAKMVNAYFYGREYYYRLKARQMILNQGSGHSSESTEFKPGSEISFSEILEGDHRIQIYTKHNIIFERRFKREGISERDIESPTNSFERNVRKDEAIWVGDDLNFGFDKRCLNINDYLQQMEGKIQTFIKYKEKDKSEKNSDDLVAQDTKWIKLACCHLYGFAEEAKKQGNQETFDQIVETVDQYFPYQEYQRIISDRLDDYGNFRLTKKDLGITE